MATNLNQRFPTKSNPPDANYPSGSIKNETNPGVTDDGTPLDADIGNDVQGFFQSTLARAGVTANNSSESVSNPQVLDALMKLSGEQSNAGDSQLAGGKIWPVENRSAAIGDTGLIDISILKDSQENALYQTSVTVYGDITALDFTAGTATVGGVDVTLMEWFGGKTSIQSATVAGMILGKTNGGGIVKHAVGQVWKTTWYASLADDGGAEYLISTGAPNGIDKIDVGNGLIAILIAKNKVNIEQLGGLSGQDIAAQLQHAVNNYNHVHLPGTSYNSTAAITVSSTCHRITGETIATNMRFYGVDGFVLEKDACEISEMTIFSLTSDGMTPDPKLYTGIRCQGVKGATRSRISFDNLFMRGWGKCTDLKYTGNSTISRLSTVNCLTAVSLFGLCVNNSISDSNLVGDLSANSIVLETIQDAVGGTKGEGLMISNTLIASGNINLKSDGFLSLNVSNCVIDLAEDQAIRLTNVQSFKLTNSWVWSKKSSIIWADLSVGVDQDATISGCNLISLDGFIDVGSNNNDIKFVGNDITGPNRLMFIEVGDKKISVIGNDFKQTDASPTLSSIFCGMSEGTTITDNTGDCSIQRHSSVNRVSISNNEGDAIITQGSFIAPPTQGTWNRNDIVYNAASQIGQPIGWICVIAGTPGAWGSMGNLS